VRAGERVAIISANRVEYPILLTALWRMQAVACPVNPLFPEETIVKFLKKIKCRKVIDFSEKPALCDSPAVTRISLDDISSFHNVNQSSVREWSLRLEQDATIIATSGTTADPKAVLHSFGNHYFNALGSNENIPVEPGDRWLLSLPLYHVGGLAILFRVMLGGGAVVLTDRKADLCETIIRHKVTHLSLVATQLYRLVQGRFSSGGIRRLKTVLVGGGTVPRPLIEQAHEKNLPLFTTYGLTETASQVTTTQPGAPLDKLFTSGRCLKYRQVRIGRDSEILVKGDTLFRGYVEGDTVSLPLGSDGWFHTGDLGVMDDSGYLTVIGRKDNMFISGGENVYPEEIESALTLLEGVTDAVVVPVEDDEFGHRPAVFIRTVDDKPVGKETLVRDLGRHLPRFKIPVRFYRWPVLDDAPPAKPPRRLLQELLRDGDVTEIT
jgi:O-succinylbenzoic acid--CoA ligase